MKSITQVPIKFMGLGEKPDEFEIFHPDRLASRILGMGDVVSLVERAQENIDEKEAERLAEKMRKADFNLEDFLAQMQQVKKMGSLGSIVSMLPGASGIQVGDEEEKKMARTEAIILSMTLKERRNPRILRGNRLKRIADGSGVQVRDVNALLKQFGQMQKMMKMMNGGKGRKMMKAMKAQMGESGGMPGLPGM
jgi:signal recognition particle subunit SRP54